jgi:hypothetical protein
MRRVNEVLTLCFNSINMIMKGHVFPEMTEGKFIDCCMVHNAIKNYCYAILTSPVINMEIS